MNYRLTRRGSSRDELAACTFKAATSKQQRSVRTLPNDSGAGLVQACSDQPIAGKNLKIMNPPPVVTEKISTGYPEKPGRNHRDVRDVGRSCNPAGASRSQPSASERSARDPRLYSDRKKIPKSQTCVSSRPGPAGGDGGRWRGDRAPAHRARMLSNS